MKAGDRVRVSSPIVLFHHPKHRNQPHNAEGMEGTVKEVMTAWQGRPISPNFPVVVEFEIEGMKRPFKVHLANNELELL
ncbi:MAG: ferredoxin-thioredoxin reductase variable chain [Leptolyngbyaceae cyanobacterium]